MIKIFKIAVGVCCMTMLAAGLAVGAESDITIEQTMEISGMPGQPPMNTTQKIWVSPGKVRMEMQGGTELPGMGNTTTIIRNDLGKVFVLDDKAKTYMEMPLDFAAGIGGDMQIKCELQSTGNKRKIGEWDCTEHIITTTGGPMSTKVVVWTTDDIKYEDKLRETMLEATSKNPMMKPLAEKLRQLKGFPVEQNIEIDMGGMKMNTVTRLKSIVQGEISEDKFELPKNYAKAEMTL